MSLDNQQKPRRDMDFMQGEDTNFHNFDNIDLRLEEVGNEHYDGDSLQNYKMNGLQPYRQQSSQNVISSHSDLIQQPAQSLKYSDFYNQPASMNVSNEHPYQYSSNAYDNTNQIKKQAAKNTNASNGNTNYTNYSSIQNGGNYQTYQQEQLPIKGSGIGSSNCLSQSGSTGVQKQQIKAGSSNAIDQEQQKQIKLINALKSNPQDLEQILEEQEKQQTIQKKLKIETDQKNNLSRHSSSIQLTNYSPTREHLKRVESNTSLNGENKPSSKNLSKIKGNVKNAYIKKITSLLNLQNAPASDQHDNFQEPRRPDNSDDSDDSRSKSYDNTKQEDGKKVMKNRESARNSRQRKKIYIELLEKKINELTQQIEEQCVNIEKSQKEICKILDNHNHVGFIIKCKIIKQIQIKAFVQTRHDYIQKIGEMSYAEKPSNEQLGYILDSLRLRIGAQGTYRQKAISLYFRTIMKYFMQSTIPYLIYGYQQNMSEDQEFNRCVEIFKKICNIQDETQVFKFLPHLKKFLECRQNFKECYGKMKKIRKNVFKREESIEKLLDGLSLLHPTQMGKFLKGLDKFRKYREIRLQRKALSESTDAYEVDSSVFGKQFAQPDRQINKLRQYTMQNQQLNNNSNYAQIHQQQQQIYQPVVHPPPPPILETNDDHHMEIVQQSKIGIPQNFYYSKSFTNVYNPVPAQQTLKQEQPSIGSKYMYQQIAPNLNGQNINSTKPPTDYDQFYHQQPYKKPFYNIGNEPNNPPY